MLEGLSGAGGRSVFNHLPGDCNVLYMDGHVEFKKYSMEGEFPANGAMAYFNGNTMVQQPENHISPIAITTASVQA